MVKIAQQTQRNAIGKQAPGVILAQVEEALQHVVRGSVLDATARGKLSL